VVGTTLSFYLNKTKPTLKFRVFWDILPRSHVLTDVSEMRTASIIALITDAVCTTETSVNIYLTTRQYIPEDSKLHTRRRENMKSNKTNFVVGRFKFRDFFI
jgi:hypothetical protein